MAGYPGGGIRTFNDLAERCIPIDGCLIWNNHCCVRTGVPKTWYPVLGRVMTAAAVAYHLKHGDRPPTGYRYVSVCGNIKCMAHRELKTLSEITAGAHTPIQIAKLTRANRERTAKLTSEMAAEIRISDETGRALAAKYGVSEQTISSIRKGKRYRPIGIPNSSIFNLGG
jgi:hypothetical protein